MYNQSKDGKSQIKSLWEQKVKTDVNFWEHGNQKD